MDKKRPNSKDSKNTITGYVLKEGKDLAGDIISPNAIIDLSKVCAQPDVKEISIDNKGVHVVMLVDHQTGKLVREGRFTVETLMIAKEDGKD